MPTSRYKDQKEENEMPAYSEILLWIGVIGAIGWYCLGAIILSGVIILPLWLSASSGFNQIFFGLLSFILAGLWFFIFYFIHHQRLPDSPALKINEKRDRADWVFIIGGIVALVFAIIAVLIFSNIITILTMFSENQFMNQVLYGVLFCLFAIFAFFLFYFLSIQVRNHDLKLKSN